MDQIQTSIASDMTQKRTLRMVLRNAPALAPEDSLQRFAQLIRFEPMGMLPVVDQGQLLGVLAQTDLMPLLRISDPAARAEAMQRPVIVLMQPSVAILRSHMDLEEAGEIFASSGQTMLPVLDQDDYYLGAVSANDLLIPELPAPRPARIGGMATPFGVYLTDGTVQAGVGNFALMASGVMMTGLWLLAIGILTIGTTAISWVTHRPFPLLVSLTDDLPLRNPWLGFASIGEGLLVFVLFMLLMRLTRLAGYHAAEHQTVHAIERCEVLAPGIVQRMPRAHPRCGTNLMAAVIVFLTLRQALNYIPALNGAVELMAGVATLFVWRPLGTFLQEKFTTKPADSREIASGIKAGDALLERYLEQAPIRPTLARRIWCSGMLQVLMGSALCWGLVTAIWNFDSILKLFTHH